VKFIDDKGRIFGLINLLDLLVLAVLAIVLYLGISTFIALKQPPVLALGITPSQIEAGKPAPAVIQLDNKRIIQGAELLLIPESFSGSTTILTGQTPQIEQNRINVTIPGDLLPGQYRLELQTMVMDVLRRKSTWRVPVPVPLLVTPAPPVQVEKNTFDNKCLWNLTLPAILLDGGGTGSDSILPGSLTDNTGLVRISVASPPEDKSLYPISFPSSLRKRAVRAVDLEATDQYDRIQRLLSVRDKSLLLFGQEKVWEFYLPGRAGLELDLVIYIDNRAQAAGLVQGAKSRAGQGGVEAEIIYSFGAVENPWFNPSQSAYSSDKPQPFSVNRVRLDCEITDGGLYFRGQPLDPNRLLNLELNGKSYTAGVLNKSQAGLSLPVKVSLQFVPERMTPLLKAGLPVVDPADGSIVGVLQEILDNRESPLPAENSYLLSKIPSAPQFRRLLVQFSLDCISSAGQISFTRQPVGYGRPISLQLLGQQLQGVVTNRDRLPALENPTWREVKILFTNVPPWIADKLEPGLEEYAPNGPTKIRFRRVVSEEPTPDSYPLNKNLTCLVEVLLTRSSEMYIMGENPFLLGTRITFTTQTFSIIGEVVGF